MKTCTKCQCAKSLDEFYKTTHTKDGFTCYCKICMGEYRKKYRDEKHDELKHKARLRYKEKYRKTTKGYVSIMWGTMNQRCGKGSYKNIKVEMTKDEWVQFATPFISKFLEQRPDETPSVDRLDPNGNYSINNIRIISYQENLLRSRFNFARFGIDEKSGIEQKLDLISKMFVGNCEALQVSPIDAIKYLKNIVA